ncbi:MAG: hypothetical protein C0434_08985 [Xanthomonadaceae bacterium]|nr:hypothetical protein [Xanthomonadaceae bacterium]
MTAATPAPDPATDRLAERRAAFAAFDRLLACDDAGARAAILDALAAEAPAVHADLLRLLDADRGATAAGFLSGSAEQRIGTALAADVDATADSGERQPGTVLGAYRLERLLGAGGMGEVWLGRRIDGLYDGTVAIKTLHPHLVQRGLRERFAREGRLLARLQHPNIARLLDAGVDADGALYLVLEHVDGQPLDQWCAARQLDVPARLRLVVAVCMAVAAAHAQRIVHRDLKPSNILVTADGSVKLLDFGIARLVEAEHETDGSALTRLGARALTPEYAAPEQIRGEPVSAAADVHALGVLLHELLTGMRPYDRPGMTTAQIERAVLDQEPQPPSQRVADPQLRRRLRGALDTVCLRALDKRPAERYRGAAELAEDLQRVLDDRPILARPDSLAGRGARFVRRYRSGVIAAGFVLAALLTGLGVALWQAGVARQAAQRADAEARKALAVKDFLVDIFERNSAGQRGGAMLRQASAEDLLARGAARIRDDLHEAPAIRAELLGTIGRLYRDLLLLPPALDLLAEQVQLRRVDATDAPGRAALLRALLDHGAALSAASEYEASNAAVREARTLIGPPSTANAEARIDALAIEAENAYWQRPSIDPTADRLFGEALALIEAGHPRHPQRIAVLLGLARTAEQAENPAGNERRLREALALTESDHGTWPSYERAMAHQQLGQLLQQQQRYTLAARELRAALALYADTEAPGSPWIVIASQLLAGVLADTGDRSGAETLLRGAIASFDPRAGDRDSEERDSLAYAYGWLLYQRGQPAQAAAQLEPLLDRFADEPAQRQATMTRLARVRLAQGDPEAASRLLDAALPILLADRGERSLAHANWLAIRAELALDRGQPAAALADLRRAREAWTPPAPPLLHVHTLRLRWNEARTRLALGDAAAAERAMRDTLGEIAGHPEAAALRDEQAQTRVWLGRALLAQDRAAEALPELARATQLRVDLDAADSLWLAEARLDQADALAALGRRREARALRDAARATLPARAALPSRLNSGLTAR